MVQKIVNVLLKQKAETIRNVNESTVSEIENTEDISDLSFKDIKYNYE